jgi:hypothetical protein
MLSILEKWFSTHLSKTAIFRYMFTMTYVLISHLHDDSIHRTPGSYFIEPTVGLHMQTNNRFWCKLFFLVVLVTVN